MRDRPILFNAPMVRAILEGRKTQTRRAVKLLDGRFVCSRHRHYLTACDMKDSVGPWWHPHAGHPGEPLPPAHVADACPFGKPGDRLWVRETFQYVGCEPGEPGAFRGRSKGLYPWNDDGPDWHCKVVFAADAEQITWDPPIFKPSIHMPRWASRIQLEVREVRVERLNDIGEADARAEGYPTVPSPETLTERGMQSMGPKAWFSEQWARIYGYGTTGNPWVWVIQFRRV